MSKKGENIYKRKDGRWEGRYIKASSQSSPMRYGYVYGKSYSETKAKLTLVKAKHIIDPTPFQTYKGTFSDWLVYWLQTMVRNDVKATTYTNYVRLANKHLLPFLGDKKLTNIQIQDLQSFVYHLKQIGLAPGSINNIFTLLKKCLNEAKKQAYIKENPALYIVLPKQKRKEVSVLTLAQQRKLEKQALLDPQCSPIILSLYSGMRLGEISGLKWSDIDLENNVIHVQRTVSRIMNDSQGIRKTKIIEGTPKSADSARKIPLAKNLKQYVCAKKIYSKSEYVVTDGTGRIDPRTIANRFKKDLEKAGLSETNFHVLRHTFATRCIENDVDIASVSKILGHKSIKMTLDIYTSSLFETRQVAMATLDALFDPTL